MQRQAVPTPTQALLEEYLAKWCALEDYVQQENALYRLFHELCPHNTNIEDILIKSASLNHFYSTQVYYLFQLVKHIFAIKNLDDRIQAGDKDLIDEIATITITDNKGNLQNKRYYSFATKFCSHHNQDDFAIYDSFIDKVLRHFRKTGKISPFQDADLKNYYKYSDMLCEVKSVFSLKATTKELDRFLWQFGKDYFLK